MTTTTKVSDLRQVLNSARPDQLADVLKLIQSGTMFSPIKIAVAALTATAAPDITSAAVKAAATVSGITLDTDENLPAVGLVKSLQVVASGTATSLGTYIVGPDGTPPDGSTPIIPPGGANAAVGVASINEAGTIITFPNTITAFILEYIPRPSVVLTTSFSLGAPS